MLSTAGVGLTALGAATPLMVVIPVLSAGAFVPAFSKQIAKASLVTGALTTATYGSGGVAAYEMGPSIHENHAFENDFVM